MIWLILLDMIYYYAWNKSKWEPQLIYVSLNNIKICVYLVMWVHSLVSADLHFLQLVPSLQTYVVAVALFNVAKNADLSNLDSNKYLLLAYFWFTNKKMLDGWPLKKSIMKHENFWAKKNIFEFSEAFLVSMSTLTHPSPKMKVYFPKPKMSWGQKNPRIRLP